jgi:hypothetical protein
MDEPIITQQRESVKLVKTTKGYTWEIKLLIADSDTMDVHEDLMIRLDAFNKELQGRYGNNVK